MSAACRRFPRCGPRPETPFRTAPRSVLDRLESSQHDPPLMSSPKTVRAHIALYLLIACGAFGCEEKKKPPAPRDTFMWSWLERGHTNVPDGNGVALALWRRWVDEIRLADSAAREFKGDEERKHLQRAADYELAARIYYETGKYPPGFDADLSTK